MKKNYYLIIAILGLFVLGIMACNKTEPEPQLSVLVTSSPLEAIPVITPALPETGKATITGKVINRSTSQPLINIPVRLAEVYRQDDDVVFVLDGAFSPGAITDIQGHFVIESIEAREYVIVVGDVEGVYEIITDPSGIAQVWNFLPDQVTDLGALQVLIAP